MVDSRKERGAKIDIWLIDSIGTHPNTNPVSTVASQFGVSRQSVSRRLKKFIDAGAVDAHGSGRNRKYRLRTLEEKQVDYPNPSGLEEDRLWRDDFAEMVEGKLPQNITDILFHGFTEIVNNVIDHSEATIFRVTLKIDAWTVKLVVVDLGIGIFNKVVRDLNLADPIHAVLELSKGKLTTAPENHSGEGLFFTSRLFDRFVLSSGDISLLHGDDGSWLFESGTGPEVDGTLVEMVVRRLSDTKIESVFEEYQGDDLGFSRTHVPVNLARYGQEKLVSRSQAKRLLKRFDQFAEVLLDFKGVDFIGQAFADEVFRVFTRRHKKTKILAGNACPKVRAMIDRVTSPPSPPSPGPTSSD